MGVRKTLRVLSAYYGLHIKTAMEYRINFFVQATFMIINNLMWLLIWFFMFGAISSLNGYGFKDAALIFAIATFAYGFARILFGRVGEIAEDIIEGKFDIFLSFPIDELFHAAISKWSFHAVGDIVTGLLLIFIIVPEHSLLVILVSILGMFVLMSFWILMDALGFFMQRPDKIRRTAHSLVLAFGTWPVDAFHSSAKTIIYGMGLAFMAMVPYHVVTSLNPLYLWYLFLVSATMLVGAILVFKYGTYRYESGNLVSQRS